MTTCGHQICAAYRAAMSGMAKRLDELEKVNNDRV